jgi:hypothetical protein
MCPDLERCHFYGYIKSLVGRRKDAGAVLLNKIRADFDNPRSACPDVEIGGIMDACIGHTAEILCAKDAFNEMEKQIVGYLHYNSPTKIETLIWIIEDDSWEGEALVAALKSLVGAGYVLKTEQGYTLMDVFGCKPCHT